MMSEKAKVKSEKTKSPFEGGMIKCVERLIWGDDFRNVDFISTAESSKVPSRIFPLCLRHFPPSKGDFLIAITMLFVLFLGTFTTPLLAQSSESLQNTPLNLPLLGETTYPKLHQYLQTAIEQNPELRSMRTMVEADRERVREAGVLMDPEITVAYDFNPMMYDSQLGRFSVSAMQMFPWFGTLGARRDLQRSVADANEAQVSVRQLEILRDVKLAWFDIAEIREQIRITEETLELVRDLEKLVEARYETGRAGQADILRIQMEEERLKTRIADLKDRINPMKASFNELLNRDRTAEVETAHEISMMHVGSADSEIRSAVRQQNPLYNGIAAERAEAEKERRLASLSGRPEIGIGVEVMGRDFGPMSMFPDARESIVGMATVRVPLFRSRYNSQRRQADHRIRSLDLRENETENRLMAQLEEYLEEVRRSERTTTLLSEELVPRAQQALTILSEEYSVGNVRFDELLQIQRELLDLEIERIEAVVNQNKAIAKIESLMGSSPP